ncbi:hypothetical protein V6N12_030783 [Hibiscus sabdariffa]|uniref:Uncharacterized protein n=1 Tax=Hibiscus sabdariffa TaxID=183260 RepID=A0ABR2EAJ0_9ROSI
MVLITEQRCEGSEEILNVKDLYDPIKALHPWNTSRRVVMEKGVDSAHYAAREGVKELKTTRSGCYVSIDELGSHSNETARLENQYSFGLTPFPSLVTAMEADDGDDMRSAGSVDAVNVINGHVGTTTVMDHGKEVPRAPKLSYANMVSGTSQSKDDAIHMNVEDDVMVLDEDCIVDDSGDFPTISASPVVDLVEPATGSIYGGQVPSIDSKGSYLYGPWMVVQNHRRRGLSDAKTRKMSVPQGAAVVQHSFTDNAAFKASNMDKKSKGARKGLERVQVISFVEGQQVKSTAHSSRAMAGDHMVVDIVEQGHGDKKTLGVKITKPHGVINKPLKDAGRRGPQGGKQAGFYNSHAMNLSRTFEDIVLGNDDYEESMEEHEGLDVNVEEVLA